MSNPQVSGCEMGFHEMIEYTRPIQTCSTFAWRFDDNKMQSVGKGTDPMQEDTKYSESNSERVARFLVWNTLILKKEGGKK